MNDKITPFSLKDAPALIERLLPVQKLSAEAFKERKAGAGQTLVPLGAYWKGRKPLILAKACILGCLLPATDDPSRDLEIFEKLMAMDDESLIARVKRRPTPKEILGEINITRITDYFDVEPEAILGTSAPVNWSMLESDNIKFKVAWRHDVTELEKLRLQVQMLPRSNYRKRVVQANRPEEVPNVHDHIWDSVNSHLGTRSKSLPELLEQLGVMRFGHRPRIADTFCGSGQITFEASRLGCDAYASDLNPVACMLAWGSLHVVGASEEGQARIEAEQRRVRDKVLADIDSLDIETDGEGWKSKAHLYCVEVRCPQTGWLVPLLPSRLISHGKKSIAELIPDAGQKRYEIVIRSGVSPEEMADAAQGTVQSGGRGQDPYLIHAVNGVEYRTKISTIRGDYRKPDGSYGNRLRLWDKGDFLPRTDDIFRERLYCIQWMRQKKNSKGSDIEFRTITSDDLYRERIVETHIGRNLAAWQENGWIPDMRIEPGEKTDEPIRTRGWTYWHHLFPPRHLLILGLIRKYSDDGNSLLMLSRILNYTSKLCIWSTSKPGESRPGEGGRTGGGSDNPVNVFYNQALNTLLNYGCRASVPLLEMFNLRPAASPCHGNLAISCQSASTITTESDIYVTDPPYGDAVIYEEILEFFIAWLRKNPPPEFSDWIWDSRRSLAIKGEEEAFRQGMVAAYKRMTDYMPGNGIQVIMFTHQSGALWADMANIVWASGLQVTAAWYVVTETDSALKEGSYVKGTVLLVCRKRQGAFRITRDDLAWEIQEEVEAQVASLTGLNQQAKGLYRDENVFEDADLQMAGYAAALRSLTRYAFIDGRDMTSEAVRPRVRGETTFVDDLITFAVDTANHCLVPQGIEQAHWDRLGGAERFYLKMLDLEARGAKSLDNYQNFAKAFKVRDFRPYLASQKAGGARLKGAVELGADEMSEGSELHQSTLRAVLYAMMELEDEVDGSDVLAHLVLNIPDYYGDTAKREMAINIVDYIEGKLDRLRPDEAGSARVLGELVKNQRLG